MDRISNKDFHKWLKEGTAPLRCEGNGYHHAFIRFPKNDDFVYMFVQSAYHGTDVIRNDVFDFCGLYYIPEEIMYCEDYRISDLVEDWEYEKARRSDNLHKAFVSQFQESVNNIIRENPDVIGITELTDMYYRDQLARIRERNKDSLVASLYFKGMQVEDIVYECEYEPEHWNEETLLEYIRDRDAYLEKTVNSYLTDRKERILYELKKNEVLRQTFKELMEDTEHPYHKMKKITDAIERSGAKTVKVSINKNGEDFTFKTEASSLKGLNTYYSTYYMTAPDRNNFEKLFGDYADYKVEDIRKITYGKRTLYEYEPSVQNESEVNHQPSQEMTISM